MSQASLWSVKDLAARLAIAPRTVWRLADSGRLPKPKRIAACVRWNPQEIEAWLEAGCPSCRESRIGTRS
jgi:predicted DNA-binding transcriptional regulator AlpA